MKFKSIISVLLIFALGFFCYAEKASYSISPFSGGLPSSSLKKTAVTQTSSTPLLTDNATFRTAVIVCAVAVAALAVYGFCRMKTSDSSNCADAFCDDCYNSNACDNEFWNSIKEDCYRDMVQSCADSLVENCNGQGIVSAFAKGSKIIPVYVR